MNQQEKLKRIRARCVELLAIAERRTQGEWADCPETLDNGRLFNTINARDSFVVHVCSTTHVHEDARFIASCAGPAEAGWKATIAAIDGLQSLSKLPQVEAPDEMHRAWEQDAREASEHLNAIIAAWPEELL
jgi:hypothetical protein